MSDTPPRDSRPLDPQTGQLVDRLLAHGWEEFLDASEDLVTHHRAALLRFYSARQLDSDLARRTFVLPRSPELASEPMQRT